MVNVWFGLAAAMRTVHLWPAGRVDFSPWLRREATRPRVQQPTVDSLSFPNLSQVRGADPHRHDRNGTLGENSTDSRPGDFRTPHPTLPVPNGAMLLKKFLKALMTFDGKPRVNELGS